MVKVHVQLSPIESVLLLMSMSIWLCICRWGFRCDMKDQQMACVRHAKFFSRTIFVQNQDIDKACRVLNRVMGQEGIYQQFRYCRYYEKPTHMRRRVNFERCKALYDEDMSRKIKFLLRTNRVEAIPGSA